MTLIVNLFAGPGAGKSTSAAAAFAELKLRRVNAELVTEYAKDMAWEDSIRLVEKFPIYTFAQQHRRIQRVVDKVDVVITDSPLLLCLVYQTWSPELEALVLSEHHRWPNLNVEIERVKPYHAVGRGQTADEAMDIDRSVDAMLSHHRICPRVTVPGDEQAGRRIADIVEMILDLKATSERPLAA